MSKSAKEQHLTIDWSDDGCVLLCRGDWTVMSMGDFNVVETLDDLPSITDLLVMDVGGIRCLDTAGALFIHDIMNRLSAAGRKVSLIGLNKQFKSLLDLLSSEEKIITSLPFPAVQSPGLLYQLGKWFMMKWAVCVQFITFMGEVFTTLFFCILQKKLSLRLVVITIQEAGFSALPIVALLSFLLGVVLSYQVLIELAVYNVSSFVININGMVVLREFGPLIAAIIVASRTSTGFTAQIGSMKVNEEIDALRTMGISPIAVLVSPKVVGVFIVLPLLVIWADLFGVLGGAIMARYEANFSYYTYFHQFQFSIPVTHYIVGLMKAPFFALIIALVGCFQGLNTETSADSVGKKTMQSAVQSIFLIIITDAVFSILLSWRNI